MMPSARVHLARLVGREILTLSGKPNRVLAIAGEDVIVATSRSPSGKPVPIAWVQDAMDMLTRDGEVTINVETVGYRSAFVGAVLATLPGTHVRSSAPPKIMLDRAGAADSPASSPRGAF